MGLGIGAGEILVILVIALIIWGPNKLPEIARTLGKMTRTLRKASFDFTSSVTRELEKEREPQSHPSKVPDKKAEESPSRAAAASPREKKKADKEPGGAAAVK